MEQQDKSFVKSAMQEQVEEGVRGGMATPPPSPYWDAYAESYGNAALSECGLTRKPLPVSILTARAENTRSARDRGKRDGTIDGLAGNPNRYLDI